MRIPRIWNAGDSQEQLAKLESDRARASALADQAMAEIEAQNAAGHVMPDNELGALLEKAFRPGSTNGEALLVFAYIFNHMYSKKPNMWLITFDLAMRSPSVGHVMFLATATAWSYGFESFGPCQFTD